LCLIASTSNPQVVYVSFLKNTLGSLIGFLILIIVLLLLFQMN
jgi:hypothetical protein